MIYVNQVCGQLVQMRKGNSLPQFNNPLIGEIIMETKNMKKEENRVYSLYTCGIEGWGMGLGFKSQDWCYETLNERRMTKESNRHSSQKEHYYKIKW